MYFFLKYVQCSGSNWVRRHREEQKCLSEFLRCGRIVQANNNSWLSNKTSIKMWLLITLFRFLCFIFEYNRGLNDYGMRPIQYMMRTICSTFNTFNSIIKLFFFGFFLVYVTQRSTDNDDDVFSLVFRLIQMRNKSMITMQPIIHFDWIFSSFCFIIIWCFSYVTLCFRPFNVTMLQFNLDHTNTK